ncbi:ACP S-malonyltransferase [Microaerobacter geothermalis]|uniref:ACP S-malonyltransferase n=1 Tax=Microaerobacter geothermalis TaxID=674972 RepID=UPI001F30817A|nr:ACP S-malonyltransferase [Microaerobacter geothermalis]MCF6095034.1 ACP S-malonyltransferase [Microaerobacter geothermalis]
MKKIAFIFPGQGSQVVGMGKAIAEADKEAAEVFAIADEVLGYSLSKLCFEGPEEELRLTENTQPAILTTSMALYRIFQRSGVTPAYFAGHSLGEYSALVAGGALSVEEGIKIVHMRGRFMEEAVPAGQGAMSAVLGMDRGTLEKICQSVTNEGYLVQAANLNCPGQIVISGTAEGVQRAGALLKENGAKRVIPLSVSGPFHSSLMKPAALKLEGHLLKLSWKDPVAPIISNVDAKPAISTGQIISNLVQQVYHPVLWEDSVRWMIDAGIDTFVEIGPGNVLSGLVKKISREVTTISIQDPVSMEEGLQKLL